MNWEIDSNEIFCELFSFFPIYFQVLLSHSDERLNVYFILLAESTIIQYIHDAILFFTAKEFCLGDLDFCCYNKSHACIGIQVFCAFWKSHKKNNHKNTDDNKTEKVHHHSTLFIMTVIK